MAERTRGGAGTERVNRMSFGSVYPLYLRKVEKKGRSQTELDRVIEWLTGYDAGAIESRAAEGSDFETFFDQAPAFTPKAEKITGSICGYRVEEIEDEILWKLRCLDKLVDELAKGRAMEKILRD